MEAADLLSGLVRANLVGAVAIAIVLALRAHLRAAFGARLVYRLWLIVPASMTAVLLPARTVLQIIQPSAAPLGSSSITPEPLVFGLAGEAAAPLMAGFDLAVLGVLGWMLGALGFAGLLIMSQIAFQRGLGRMTADGDLLRTRAAEAGPVVLGVLRPRVVLPSDFESRFSVDEQRLVLEHEQTHCRTGDQLINFGAAVLRCVCWFNPLVHAAVRHVRVDQELACDAAVIARQPQSRGVYAQAMLKAQFSPLAAPIACYWPTRSAVLLKQRIIALQDDMPSRSRRVAGACLVVLVCVTASATAWAIQPAQVVIEIVSDDALAPSISTENHAAVRQSASAPDRFDDQDSNARIPGDADEINRVSPGDGTPLIRAARAGDIPRTRELLRQGALVDKAARGDGNPLINAARFRGLEMVKLLVDAGADVNAYVPGDETPLINASLHGDLVVIGYLIDRGADPNLVVPTTNFPGDTRSPLSMAANATVADYLKSRGARR